MNNGYGFEYRGERVYFRQKESIYHLPAAQRLLKRAADEGGLLRDLCSCGHSPIYLTPVINPFRLAANPSDNIYGFRVTSYTLFHGSGCPCLVGRDPDMCSPDVFQLKRAQRLVFDEFDCSSGHETEETTAGFGGLANALFSKAYTDAFLDVNQGSNILNARCCPSWPDVAAKFRLRMDIPCTEDGLNPLQIAKRCGLELVFGRVDLNLGELLMGLDDRQFVLMPLPVHGWTEVNQAAVRFRISTSDMVTFAGLVRIANNFLRTPFFFFASIEADNSGRHRIRHLYTWPVASDPIRFFPIESNFEGECIVSDSQDARGAVYKVHRLREASLVLQKMHPLWAAGHPVILPYRPDAMISLGASLGIYEYLGRADQKYLEQKQTTEKWFKSNSFPYPVLVKSRSVVREIRK